MLWPMSPLEWYFPESVDEAAALITREGVVPHGGGTGLLRGSLKGYRGLVALHRLPLKTFAYTPQEARLGALLTFSETVEHLAPHEPRGLLVQALYHSSTELLRNRITLGGSVAMAPPWSDLMAPLLALRARVVLRNPQGETVVPVAEYLKTPGTYRNTLITEIRYTPYPGKAFFYRAVRTRNDLPAFTLALLLRVEEGRVRDPRIVLFGTRGKGYEATGVMERLENQPVEAVDPEAVAQALDAAFHPHPRMGSPEYQQHLARTALARGLQQLLEATP